MPSLRALTCAVRSLGGTARRKNSVPGWSGASAAYSKAQQSLERLNAAEYQTQLRRHLKRGHARSTFRYSPPQEVRDVIEAMDRGDEESIKAFNLMHLRNPRRNGELNYGTTVQERRKRKYTVYARGGLKEARERAQQQHPGTTPRDFLLIHTDHLGVNEWAYNLDSKNPRLTFQVHFAPHNAALVKTTKDIIARWMGKAKKDDGYIRGTFAAKGDALHAVDQAKARGIPTFHKLDEPAKNPRGHRRNHAPSDITRVLALVGKDVAEARAIARRADHAETGKEGRVLLNRLFFRSGGLNAILMDSTVPENDLHWKVQKAQSAVQEAIGILERHLGDYGLEGRYHKPGTKVKSYLAARKRRAVADARERMTW